MREYEGWIEKPLRIRNPKAIEAARREWCERCGTRHGAREVHHVRSRGAGGSDVPGNLVTLCWLCHYKVHDGKIPRTEIELLVLVRDGIVARRPSDGKVWCATCENWMVPIWRGDRFACGTINCHVEIPSRAMP